MSMITYDALIVGTRCAGAATALHLAKAGLRVLMVEREVQPADTLSTHALMRPAVALLSNWGVLDHIAQTTPCVGATHFFYGSEQITVPIRPKAGMAGLYAPRRWVLDKVLRDAAQAHGATLQLGTRFMDVLRDGSGRVVGAELLDASGARHTVRAHVVIGADGRSSSVARAVDAQVLQSSENRTAVCYSYLDGIPNEGYRWYYDRHHYAGLIPTNGGQHCYFAGCAPARFAESFSPDPFAGMMAILSRWEPDLAARLSKTGPAERLRRFTGAGGFIRKCTGPGWALVGDAGYFKDPATAHGITDAFLDAQRLGDAILAGGADLTAYDRARDPGAATFFEITQAKAAFESTLPQLKSLHMRANACMQAEMAEVEARYAPQMRAA